jgi:hypothetical protein
MQKTAATPKSLDIVINGRTMRIGSRELLQNNKPVNFNGVIDEVWIFDDVLTPIQRRNLMNFNDIKGDPKAVAAVVSAPPAPTPAVVTPAPAAAVTPSPARAAAARVESTPPSEENESTGSSGSGRVIANGSMHRMSPMKIAGVVFGVSMVITLASYLIWAVSERTKLRAVGRL